VRYNVTVPVAGFATLTVEADSEREAIEAAVDDWGGEFDHLDAFHKLNPEYVDVWKASAELASDDGSGDDDE
jgi:hypothetical protein